VKKNTLVPQNMFLPRQRVFVLSCVCVCVCVCPDRARYGGLRGRASLLAFHIARGLHSRLGGLCISDSVRKGAWRRSRRTPDSGRMSADDELILAREASGSRSVRKSLLGRPSLNVPLLLPPRRGGGSCLDERDALLLLEGDMLLTQEEGRAPPEETCMALVPRSPGTPPMPVPSELDQGGMSSGDEDSPDAIVQLATEAPKVTKPKASKKRQQLNSQRENSGSSNNPPGDGELGEEDLKRRRKARALPNGALRGGRGARREPLRLDTAAAPPCISSERLANNAPRTALRPSCILGPLRAPFQRPVAAVPQQSHFRPLPPRFSCRLCGRSTRTSPSSRACGSSAPSGP